MLGDSRLCEFDLLCLLRLVSGWSEIMYEMAQTSGLVVVVYFIALVILGSFFVINLVVAVIYQSYINTMGDLKRQDAQNKAKLKNIYRCHRRLHSLSFRVSISYSLNMHSSFCLCLGYTLSFDVCTALMSAKIGNCHPQLVS